VKVCDFLAGMTVPLGMIFESTPPTVSMPKVKGVTSISTKLSVTSLVSPPRIPP